ncbi:hypothetical protein GQ44DRAFT_701218 [Phaeosphaeriaceae sp. PMI808]|nr:hypothetical protein GQ44DRAFT_701218 [Phaeosphaeriaceae sp. PMI808]
MWPLKTSDSMKFQKYQTTASVAVPSAPVSGGIDAVFENKQQEGSILIVDGNVTHHQARPTSNFKIWMKNPEVAAKIMGEYPDTQEKGIWIITKAYTAKRRSVAVVKSKGSLISFNIGATVADVAKLKPAAEWWNVREEGSWRKQEADPGDEIVLSASGIWFKQSRYWKTLGAIEKEHEQQWLDAGDDAEPILVSMPNKDGGGFVNFELVPEPFGDDDDDNTMESLGDRDLEEKPQGDEGRKGFQVEEGFSIDDEE